MHWRILVVVSFIPIMAMFLLSGTIGSIPCYIITGNGLKWSNYFVNDLIFSMVKKGNEHYRRKKNIESALKSKRAREIYMRGPNDEKICMPNGEYKTDKGIDFRITDFKP